MQNFVGVVTKRDTIWKKVAYAPGGQNKNSRILHKQKHYRIKIDLRITNIKNPKSEGQTI